MSVTHLRPVLLGALLLLGFGLATAALVPSGGKRASGAPVRAASGTRVRTLNAILDAAPVEVAPTSGLPADCLPKPGGPPGTPYQLGLVGSISNGTLTAGPVTVAQISAKFCGVVTIVPGTPPCNATGTVTSPTDGQVFGSLSASLNLIPGLAPKVPFTAHPGSISGGFVCQSSNNGLLVTLKATVSGSTGLFGLSCNVGPLTIPLSGVLTGPLGDASVTLRGNDFAVPAIASSPACSGQVPSDIDAIAGLPIPAGKATVTLPATATLYRPAA